MILWIIIPQKIVEFILIFIILYKFLSNIDNLSLFQMEFFQNYFSIKLSFI
jgi:hypothetical protein